MAREERCNMDIRDKIGLWADEKISGLRWKKIPFKDQIESALCLLIPKCNHKDFETGVECNKRGEPCWLPNWGENEKEAIEWYCFDHMHGAGYCWGCRNLWAGVEDFEFDPQGLCSNCRHDPDYGWRDEEYEDEDDFDYYPYP